MKRRIESLKSFKISKKNKKEIKGGAYNPPIEIPPIGTLSWGTYVDGFNMGTDGYEDWSDGYPGDFTR